MAATLAKLGKGTILKSGNAASPEVFTTITEVLDISGAPSSIRDLVEVTNHDTVGTDREFILGLGDGIELTVRANYVGDTVQQALLADKVAGTSRNFTMLVPANTNKTASFTALVRGWSIMTPINEAIKLEFVLKISGTPVWA